MSTSCEAAAAIADEREFIVIGSQAVLGQFPNAPDALRVSVEAESIPTATLPTGRSERLVALHNEDTGGATGWCLEVHDLAASKLVAGRGRDIEFLRVLLQERMVDASLLLARVNALPLPEERLAFLRQRLESVHTSGR